MTTVRSASPRLRFRFFSLWLGLVVCATLLTSELHAQEEIPQRKVAEPQAVMAPNPVTLQWQSLPATVRDADWRQKRWSRRNQRKRRIGRKTPSRVYRDRIDNRSARSRRSFRDERGRARRMGRWTVPYSAERRYNRRGTYRYYIFGGIDPGLPYGSYRMHLTGGYTTVCVRLCDGYFFPISFSTNQSRLMADHAVCQNSCQAPSKLFVHATGTDIDQAYDLMGKRYTSLPNAYLYRKEYLSDCRCKADPWTKEAKAVHERYAALADDPKAAAAAARTYRPSAGNVNVYRGTRAAQPERRRVNRSSRRVIRFGRRDQQRVRSSRPRRPVFRSAREPFWSW